MHSAAPTPGKASLSHRKHSAVWPKTRVPSIKYSPQTPASLERTWSCSGVIPRCPRAQLSLPGVQGARSDYNSSLSWGAECAQVVETKPPSSEILPDSDPGEQRLMSQFPLYVKGSEQSKEVIRLALIRDFHTRFLCRVAGSRWGQLCHGWRKVCLYFQAVASRRAPALPMHTGDLRSPQQSAARPTSLWGAFPRSLVLP